MTADEASEAREPNRHSQPDSSHPAKRLASGMDEVVHLFLTQTSANATLSPSAGEAPTGRKAAAPSHPIVTLACPAATPAKEELIQLLNEDTAALESGLRTIDRAFSCDPFRKIDLLAVDRLNQLVVIALEDAPDDGMLLRAISQYDWIVRHAPILRKLYEGRVIDFSFPPRIFLVAPGFSPQLTCAAHRILSPRIGCYRYRAIAVPSGTAVLFEGA